MREKIYTIPVSEAFKIECECPLCLIERRLEDENIEYVLGPSLMEPDKRMETNDKGFCKRHFEQLYNKQTNRLGLGLIIDTHLCEQNARLKKMFENELETMKKDSDLSFVKGISNKVTAKQTDTEKFIENIISELNNLEKKCAVCHKLDYTMERYIDVILYLWFKEEDFKELFNSKKGFCLKHLKQLLVGTQKHLSAKQAAVFVNSLLNQQFQNMDRLQQEVTWFTKKFDYRNNDAPWGNSKDSLIRSIQKLVGFCDLK